MTPQVLAPKPEFYRALAASLGIKGSKTDRLPQRLTLEDGRTFSIEGINSYFFPGGVHILRIKIDVDLGSASGPGGDPTFPALIDKLAIFRNPKSDRTMNRVVRESVNLMRGRRSPATSGDIRTNFAASFTFTASPAEVEQLADLYKRDLVAFLIGSPAPGRLREELTKAVLGETGALNEKASGELLLANRQGIVYLRSSEDAGTPHMGRFRRASASFILAMYVREFLRDSHGFTRLFPSSGDFIATRLKQWVLHPEVAFDESYSQALLWRVLLNQMILAERYQAWAEVRQLELSTYASGGATYSEDPWQAESLSRMMASDRRF